MKAKSSNTASVRQNSLYAWLLAARPKTLAGAAVPVMMGLTLAWAYLYRLNQQACGVDAMGTSVETGTLSWVPAILCVLFAFIMQIDANFINDYFDWKKGTDDEHRLGPRGYDLIWVGVACVVFCFLYTLLLSYIGLGDLLVLVFFGLVPVCVTFYIQTHTLTKEVILSSLACGMVIDTLLVVNNYRDRDNDRRVGKRTLVVIIGEKATEILYFALGLMAFHMGLTFFFQGQYFTFFLPTIYLMLHARTYRKMKAIKRGKALNGILAENARNMFIYGVLFSVGVVLDALSIS